MIIQENISDALIRHYSDIGMMIKQVETGNLYSEAVDVVPCRYTYTETNVPVQQDGTINPDEAVEAVKILLGRE